MIRTLLLAACVACLLAVPVRAQPVPAPAPHCESCGALGQVLDAYRSGHKSLEDAITARTARLDVLAGKALGPGLTPAERAEVKQIGDEMQQLVPARDAFKKTGDDLKKALDDCAAQCRVASPRTASIVVPRGGFTEADLGHLDIKADCPECEPAARAYNAAFKQVAMAKQQEQQLAIDVRNLEGRIEAYGPFIERQVRDIERPAADLEWMKGQVLGTTFLAKQIAQVEQVIRDAKARVESHRAEWDRLRKDLEPLRRKLQEAEDLTVALRAKSRVAMDAFLACNRERCLVVPEPEPIGVVPGGAGPVDADRGDPGMDLFARLSREIRNPGVSKADCPACAGAQRDLEAAVERMRILERENLWVHAEVERLEREVADARQADAREGRFSLGYNIAYIRLVQFEKELNFMKDQRKRVLEDIAAQEKLIEAARAALAACNRALCGDVTVGRVIGIIGNNPFDPSDPTGPKIVTGQPLVPGAIGSLQLSSASYGGGEGGAVLIVVMRVGGSAGNISVSYATTPGTASPADFTAANGTLSWRDGETASKSFSIALTDDTQVEQTEGFTVALSSPSGGAALGSPSTATITIADNDSVAPPQPAGAIQFSASSFTVAENAGSVTITVTRTGGSAGEVTVQYFTGPSSAVGGSDYQAVSGVLTWGVGDMGAKSFMVPIINDTLVEGPETFFVTLNNPTGGATLGAPATATVTINDDDVNQGPCGATGSAWTPNAGQYACSGICVPNPSPRLSINGDLVTATNFHGAPTPATFQGCGQSLASREGNLTYFGQNSHRATITRSSDANFSANIVSSGGGTCNFTCSRTGP